MRLAIRRKRHALHLTQAEVARRLGISRLVYHRIESGARIIHFNELAEICKVYRCPIDDLIEDAQLVAAYRGVARVLAK
jgi:transcriptional regulator with XRE-family HTH domain